MDQSECLICRGFKSVPDEDLRTSIECEHCKGDSMKKIHLLASQLKKEAGNLLEEDKGSGYKIRTSMSKYVLDKVSSAVSMLEKREEQLKADAEAEKISQYEAKTLRLVERCCYE